MRTHFKLQKDLAFRQRLADARGVLVYMPETRNACINARLETRNVTIVKRIR